MVTPEQEQYLRERGWEPSPYMDEPFWQKDGYPKDCVYELRTNGKEWWAARLDDYHGCLEDGWCGESYADPITCFVAAEISAWGAGL